MPAEVTSAVDDLENAGRTTMVVRRGDRYLGVLGVMDTPRDSAAPVLARLRVVGIRNLVMISGDNQRVADAVANQVGIDSARGDLLPEDKVATIRELRAAHKQVAMVGDGVNDAPRHGQRHGGHRHGGGRFGRCHGDCRCRPDGR